MQADAVLGEFSEEKSWITAVSAQLEEILIDKSESLTTRLLLVHTRFVKVGVSS